MVLYVATKQSSRWPKTRIVKPCNWNPRVRVKFESCFESGSVAKHRARGGCRASGTMLGVASLAFSFARPGSGFGEGSAGLLKQSGCPTSNHEQGKEGHGSLGSRQGRSQKVSVDSP